MGVLGQSIKRREDPRLITGEAKYTDDLQLPGMAYAAFLRSPFAHAMRYNSTCHRSALSAQRSTTERDLWVY